MYQVWRYNTLTKETNMIYENMDELINVGFSMSNDDKYFFISAGSYETSDIYYFTHENLTPIQFTPKVTNHKYNVDYHEGMFLITTNKDNSTNFMVMLCKENNTNIDNWTEFIEYNESIFIKYIIELKEFILVGYKENGHNLVRVIPYENTQYRLDKSWNIEVDDSIKNISIYCAPKYDCNLIMYSQNFLKQPPSIYKLDLASKESEFVRQKPVPNYDSSFILPNSMLQVMMELWFQCQLCIGKIPLIKMVLINYIYMVMVLMVIQLINFYEYHYSIT